MTKESKGPDLGSEGDRSRCWRCGSDRLKRLYTKWNTPIWRCSACDQVFSGQHKNADELADWYADYYTERNTTLDPLTRSRYHELLHRFETHRRSGRLLDVGCGFGFLLATAAERGWEVYGSEISSSALRYTERLGLARDRIHLGGIEDADLPPESFDVVTLLEVIEHLHDPMPTLRAVARLLRPGGVLYLTTPNYASLSRLILRDNWSVIHPEEHLSYFDTHSLVTLLAGVDLQCIDTRTTGIGYHEILRHLRGTGTVDDHPGADAVQAAREAIEGRAWLSALKRGANSVLSLMGRGDTIKLFARRTGGRSESEQRAATAFRDRRER